MHSYELEQLGGGYTLNTLLSKLSPEQEFYPARKI